MWKSEYRCNEIRHDVRYRNKSDENIRRPSVKVTNVLFVRHFFSMANWLESFKKTNTIAHQILDPDLSPYALLQAENIFVRDTQIAEFISNHAYNAATKTMTIHVSELRRTWETAYLIAAFFSKHTSQVDRLVCIKNNRLNEIDSGKFSKVFGRDNKRPASTEEQLRKFQSWINVLGRGFWVCNSSDTLLKLSDKLTTLASSLPNVVVEVVSAVTMPSDRCMIVGHSKWYTEAVKNVIRMWPGQKKVRDAGPNDALRIDNFIFNRLQEKMKPCRLEMTGMVPRGRCCHTESDETLIKSKPHDKKPGSGEITLLNDIVF